MKNNPTSIKEETWEDLDKKNDNYRNIWNYRKRYQIQR
jgi:hypothetical protein